MSSTDRKSTRLNSSHLVISYAVFCLKKKSISHAGAVLDSGPVPVPGRRLVADCAALLATESAGGRAHMRVTEAAGIVVFFFNDTVTTEIYTLSLHDALPIYFSLVEIDGVPVNAFGGSFDFAHIP